MSNNNNIKIFDGLVSKTKAYLIIIAILLIALCFFEIKLIIPSIIIYFLILVYTRWTNKKRTAELSEHIKELTINVILHIFILCPKDINPLLSQSLSVSVHHQQTIF